MLQQKIDLTLMLTLKPHPVLRKRESLLNGVIKPVAIKEIMMKETNRMKKEKKKLFKNTNRNAAKIFRRSKNISLLQAFPINRNNYKLEGVCIIGYKAVYSVERQVRFRRNTLPTSSGSNYNPSKKSQLSFNEIHGVISQKMKVFKTISVRISNSTDSEVFHTIFLARVLT
jgi:hypothetical protein